MYKNLLVAFDGSPESTKALRAGIELAKATGATLCTITVEEKLPPYLTTVETYGAYADAAIVEQIEEQRATYYANLNRQARDIAAEHGVKLDCAVVTGGEVNTIVEHARKIHCDLILVGFHAHSAISDRILGSTAHAITMNAPCSVLAVK